MLHHAAHLYPTQSYSVVDLSNSSKRKIYIYIHQPLRLVVKVFRAARKLTHRILNFATLNSATFDDPNFCLLDTRDWDQLFLRIWCEFGCICIHFLFIDLKTTAFVFNPGI